MKLLFEVKDQIHVFRVQEQIKAQDLQVIKISLSRFLESKPSFVILDFSQANLMTSDLDLQNILTELKTLALAQQINFYVAQTDIESLHAHRNITEMALTRQLQLLQNKVELREKLQKQAEALLRENESLKTNIQTQYEKINSVHTTQGLANKLNPMIEKLWSEKP